jgi:hypothetical protein
VWDSQCKKPIQHIALGGTVTVAAAAAVTVGAVANFWHSCETKSCKEITVFSHCRSATSVDGALHSEART